MNNLRSLCSLCNMSIQTQKEYFIPNVSDSGLDGFGLAQLRGSGVFGLVDRGSNIDNWN